MARHLQLYFVKTLIETFIGALALIFSLQSLAAQNNNPPGTPLPPTTTASQPVSTPAEKHGKDNKEKDAKKGPLGGVNKMEMEIREKLDMISQLTPQQLDVELQKWPRYQEMDLGERGKLLQRIQEYKERRHHQAENKARDLGLKLTTEQFNTFEKKFWEKRMQADRQLWQEMEPRRKALDQQLNNELKQEFAAYATTPTPAPTPATAPTTSISATNSPTAPVVK